MAEQTDCAPGAQRFIPPDADDRDKAYEGLVADLTVAARAL